MVDSIIDVRKNIVREFFAWGTPQYIQEDSAASAAAAPPAVERVTAIVQPPIGEIWRVLCAIATHDDAAGNRVLSWIFKTPGGDSSTFWAENQASSQRLSLIGSNDQLLFLPQSMLILTNDFYLKADAELEQTHKVQIRALVQKINMIGDLI